MKNKRKRATRMMRSRGHGYGSHKKNRGAGNRGGVGNAGTGKRNDGKKPKIWAQKKYFGKHGFKMHGIKPEVNIVNLAYIEASLDTLVASKKIEEKSGVYVIDLGKLGFNKLLSKGAVKSKLNITVDQCTTRAAEKVKAAGGEVNVLVGGEAGAEVSEEAAEEPAESEKQEDQ